MLNPAYLSATQYFPSEQNWGTLTYAPVTTGTGGGGGTTIINNNNVYNGVLTVSASGSSISSGLLLFANSNDFTFGMAGGVMTLSYSNTATASNYFFSNANNVTFGTVGSTVTASVNVGGSAVLSAGTQSMVIDTVVFGNAHGISFGLNGSTVTASHNALTNSNLFRLTANDSQLQFTSGMSNYLGTTYTSHTHSQYLNTSQSTLFQHTSATSAITSNALNTSQSSLFQHTSGMTAYLGTTYTSHTHSQYLNTSQSTLFQLTANMTDYLDTSYTSHTHSQYINTSNSTLFRHTSADSQLQFTSQMSDYLGTGYTTHTHTQLGQAFSAGAASSTFQTLSFQDSNGISFSNNGGAIRVTHDLQFTSNTSAITASALNTSQSSLFQHTSATSAITSAAVHTSSPRIQGIIGSNTTYITGSVSLRDLNGISFQSTTGQAFQITHALQFTSNTSAITASALNTSQSSLFQHTSATSAITSAALHTSASRVINIIAATNNTGGGTASLSSNVSFSAANNFTFYTSAGNAIVGSFSQSVDTLKAGTGFTSAGNNIGLSGTLNTNGLSLSATVAAQSNQNISLFALGNTTQNSSTVLNASNLSFNAIGSLTVGYSNGSIQFSAPNALTTAMASNRGSDFVQANAVFNGTNASGTIASNALSVSVAAQSAQTIGLYASSQTTGQSSSSTVDARSVSFRGAGIVSVGLSAGEYIISASAAQSVQTQNMVSVNGSTGNISLTVASSLSFSSNGSTISFGLASNITTALQSAGNYLTTAALSSQTLAFTVSGNSATTNSSQISNGGYALAGGNGVTIQQSNNTVSFSVATNYQSQGAYLTTAGLSQDSSKYAGTGVTTAGGAGLSATLNTAGLSVSIPSWLTTAALSSQTLVFSLSGNTATTNSSQISNGGFALAGGNGVTLQQSNNTVSISVATNYQSQGAYLTTAAQSTQTNAFSLGGNTGTTNSSVLSAGGYVIAGGSNITLSMSNNSLSIHAQSQSLQTQSRFNMTLSGNSTSAGAGYIQISSGVLTLAGGNNITLSQDGNAVTISAGAGGAATGISGIAASNTTYTSGSVTFRDGNGISWASTTGQQISITHDLQFTSATSAITSAAVHTSAARLQGVIGSNTTYTSGSFSLRDSNGITWQSTTGQAFQITHDLQYTSATSAITSNALNTSASRVINIVAATNSTGGGTASLSSNVSFSNTNNFTFYTSAGGAIVASFFDTNKAGTGFTSGGNNIGLSGTLNSAGLSLSATVAASNQAFSAGAASSAFLTLSFQDSNGLSFSNNAGAIRMTHDLQFTSATSAITSAALHTSAARIQAVYDGANSISSGTIRYTNANGFSFSLNGQTLSGSVATTYRASNDAIGLNTAQSNVTWTANSSGLSLDARGYAGTGTTFNGANISASYTLNSNGLQASMSVAAPGAAAENNNHALLGANTAGNTTASGSTIGLSGLNLTLSGTNASQIVISAPPVSSLSATGGLSISTNGSTISIGVPSPITQTMYNPYAGLEFFFSSQVSASLFVDPQYLPNLQFDRILLPIHYSNATNSSGSISLSIYFGIYSRNVSTLSLVSSASTSHALTASGTVGNYSLFSGLRNISIGLTATLTEGMYWLAQVSRSSSAGTNASLSGVYITQLGTNFNGNWSVAPATSIQYQLGKGMFNTTTVGIPASIAFSQIRGSDFPAFRPPVAVFASSTV